MTVRFGTTAGSWVLLASVLGSGMAFLDATAINVALPALGEDLGVGLSGFQWVVNAYLITLGALVLMGGSFGDLFGKKRLFTIGVSWFGLASIACALAPNIGVLVAARALQGIGAALMIPSSLALVQVCFHPADRSRAVGAWTGWSGLSTIIGPFVGGWLVDLISWRAVFWLNIPIAAFTLMIMAKVPETLPTGAKIDPLGAVSAASGLAALTFALIEGPVRGWSDPAVIVGAAAGVVLLGLFFAVETKVASPMLPLGLFRRRQFTGANAATLVVYFALSGLFFLLVIHLIESLGYSALEAGAAGAPVTIILFLFSSRAGALASRIGPRLPMTLGPLIGAVGAALLAGLEPGDSYLAAVLPGVIVFGFGLALTVAPLTATVLAAVEEHQVGLASGINNAIARIAGLLAIPLLPLAAGIANVEFGSPTFVDGFGTAMWVAAGLLAAGGVWSWFVIRNDVLEVADEQPPLIAGPSG